MSESDFARILLDKLDLHDHKLREHVAEVRTAIVTLLLVLWSGGYFYTLGYIHCSPWDFLSTILAYPFWPLLLGRAMSEGLAAFCK